MGIYGLLGRRQRDWNEVLRTSDFNSMRRVPTHSMGWTFFLVALSALVSHRAYPAGHFAWTTGINVVLCIVICFQGLSNDIYDRMAGEGAHARESLATPGSGDAAKI